MTGEANEAEGTKERRDLKRMETGVMSLNEIETGFPPSVKERLGIRHPIRWAYRYSDRKGEHAFVITGHVDRVGEAAREKAGHLDDVMKVAGDTLKDSLMGHKLTIGDERVHKDWGLRDFILKDNGISEEFSISFWPRYSTFSDLDDDGRVEPFIVYRTLGMNGLSDGRVKLLLYDEGKKYGVRYQNGTLDGESHTQIDKAFKELPKEAQEKVEARLGRLREEQIAEWNLEIRTELP